MRISQSKIIFSLLLLCICISSCDSNRVFDEYRSVTNAWNKSDIINFKVQAPDTINRYNLYVNLRSTKEYKYNNLYLIVAMQFPNGKVNKDTLEYKMATKEGALLGTGLTGVKENKLWYKGYKKPFVFSELGEYSIDVQHAMRENGSVNGVTNLEGVTDIGFRIESIKQ